MWSLEKLEINGGFLQGLNLSLPLGLTCIIGPRGSGKSTLAEAIRFAINGIQGASKSRVDLIQANLGQGSIVSLTAKAQGGTQYTVKRGYKQQPILLGPDGRAITSVDLDRGTFLPLDAYSGQEIEEIADEVLGEKRRALLDDLHADDFRKIHLSIAEHKRALEANADRIRALKRSIADMTEQIEELGDVRVKHNALGPVAEDESRDYARGMRQQQFNAKEIKKLDTVKASIDELRRGLAAGQQQAASRAFAQLSEQSSENSGLLGAFEQELASMMATFGGHITKALDELEKVEGHHMKAKEALLERHKVQANQFSKLAEQNRAANELVQERTRLEQQIAQLEELETERTAANVDLQSLLTQRSQFKAAFIMEREQISALREKIAEELQGEAGNTVRIRVMRNADDLEFRQMIIDGLRGAKVRNHEDILAALLRLRPEQLAQLIQANDAQSFENLVAFGTERSRKILDAFRQSIDPLVLEVVPTEDMVRIELNVSTNREPNFKDASDLSRGQKCTALLPLLLARRDSPLVIDQPEDNLDNHFIYETIVNSIQRLKNRRQMIFITHNANIPVLSEADLMIVMNSDGKVGYIEKAGTVDDCRDEIVDLLEGGKKAFELRWKRYGRT